MTLPAEELQREIDEAYQEGSALGAQAMEASLRPKLESWREACKWIAAGSLGLGAVGAALAFIYGFTLGVAR